MDQVVARTPKHTLDGILDVPAPSVSITLGLGKSDKTCEDIPINTLATYLQTHTNCYERTLPTELHPETLNRVYVDLDGRAGPMTRTEFEAENELLGAVIRHTFRGRAVILESSQHSYSNSRKPMDPPYNKLSFRIQYCRKHGTKAEIEAFVTSVVMLKLQTALDTTLPILLDSDVDESMKSASGRYLSVDTSVYAGNRKMRMWNSSKDYENRPLRLLGGDEEDGPRLIDTLITWIPSDSRRIQVREEPTTQIKKSKKTTVSDVASVSSRCTTQTAGTTYTTDPTPTASTPTLTPEFIDMLLDSISDKRYTTYDNWLTIGILAFNEGWEMTVWEEATRRHYPRYGVESGRNCAEKWATFKKGRLTQATLWKWVKEDNPTAFAALQKHCSDFWSLLNNYNHAETAMFFYNMKPDAYLYNDSLGWYRLLSTGAWTHSEKEPTGLKADIWSTLKTIILEHKATLDKNNPYDQARLSMCTAFLKQVGNRGFLDSVAAMLPENYADPDLVEKMDENRNLLAFRDKVVDLNTGEVRDICPSDYVCLTTGYEYPVTSNAEVRDEIRALLYSIWEDDTVVKYVLEVLATQLHGQKTLEEFYVFTGRGGNGKGVLGDLVKRTFGHYFHSIPHSCITKPTDKKDAPNPALAMAKGKRFTQAQEPESEDKLQVGTIKELTGGDPVSARCLFKNLITFKPQFGLFLQCNEPPKLNKLDGGIRRRMVIVSFPFQFVETPIEPHHRPINFDLKKKISTDVTWRDEFMRMLLKVYRRLITVSNGVPVKPAWVIEHSEEYMAENDAIKGWLQENFVTRLDPSDKRYKMRAEDLRTRFIDTTGTKAFDMSASKFKTLMEMNGVAQKREGHAFVGINWSVSEVPEVRMPAGSYYTGLRPKSSDDS